MKNRLQSIIKRLNRPYKVSPYIRKQIEKPSGALVQKPEKYGNTFIGLVYVSLNVTAGIAVGSFISVVLADYLNEFYNMSDDVFDD